MEGSLTLSTEMHRADWSIPYPADLNEKNVPGLLRPLTYAEHDWDDFPWHLAGRLVLLLEKPEASFEYLHLTYFFRARAAMLALTGDVLDQGDLFSALRQHHVQIGGIYRTHLLRHLRSFLKKHSLTQLPECGREHFDPVRESEQADKNRILIQSVAQAAERE